jgi:thiamine-phosphate pyrophosphorylase
VLTYYITDRTQFAGTEAERRAQLLQTIRRAAAAGVDFIQLREKDLSIRDLELLAREALQVVRAEGPSRLLINHRTDVALAAGADGVHLTGNDIAASDARALAAGRGLERDLEPGLEPKPGRQFLVAASCHSAEQVRLAEAHGADFAVLAPIFEKVSAEKVSGEKARVARNGIGLDELRRAAQIELGLDLRVEAGDARRSFPVFALGGVDVERAPLCAAAGAAGIAGIRIFQQCPDLAALVRSLRLL